MRACSLPATHLLLVFGLALLPACSDDPTTGTTKVAGQVVEQQGRKPVGSGTVQVWLASSGGGYREVGDPYPCDAQGRFSFDFDAEKQSGYLLKAEAPPGYITSWAGAPGLTAGRQNKDVVVPVLAPAWVRLVLVDELPKNRVSIFFNGYEGNGDRLNYPRDTSVVRPCIAGLTKGIIWVITDEKGADRQGYQAVSLAPLDTLNIRISF